MFSPNIMIYNESQENTDVISRKPGLKNDNQLSRKPFIDQPVNETPGFKPLKLKNQNLCKIDVLPKKELPNEQYADMCSYKEVKDNYADIPYTRQLAGGKGVSNTVREFLKYSSPKTPPPKLDIEMDQMFCQFLKDDFFLPKQSFQYEELDDVFMPDLDFNDFAI